MALAVTLRVSISGEIIGAWLLSGLQSAVEHLALHWNDNCFILDVGAFFLRNWLNLSRSARHRDLMTREHGRS